MAGGLDYGYLDRSGERSRTNFNLPTLDASNIAGVSGLFAALQTAIINMTYCTVTRVNVQASTTPISAVVPTNLLANREMKWECMFQDAVLGSTFRVEIPGPRFDTMIVNPASDDVPLTQAQVAAFKTASEAVITSPAGNAAVLIKVRLVGRNL